LIRFRFDGRGLTILRCRLLKSGAVIVACLWATPALLHAQDMRGRVVLPDSTPVPGARAELHRVSEQGGAIVDSTTTDASGRFTFTLDAEADPGIVYLAAARHDGLLYWGSPIHAGVSIDLSNYVVGVFDTTAVAGPLRDLPVGMRHVVITPGVSGMQVEEIIDLRGVADRTLVPGDDSVVVWETSLARGASSLLPGPGGVPLEDLLPEGGRIGFRGALPPSGIRIVIQYLVPSLEYSLQLDHAAERLELLVMSRPGLDVQGNGLDEVPVGSDMQIPVRRFTRSGLAEGETLSVRITPAERPAAGRPWVWLLASLALGAAALASIRLTGSNEKPR